MEARKVKLPNKIDEHYILPVLFLLVNVTLVIWSYIVHEYSQSNETFELHYRFDQQSIDNYKTDLRAQVMLISMILLITPLYLKYKRRWLLVSITFMHLGGLYYFFYQW
ncbi:MAG: hypothetical protein AAGA66_08250 [Bacteroidota bacterium]